MNNEVSHANTKFSLISLTCLGLAAIKDIPGVRNIIPEPFDVFDHVGNVSLSVAMGYVGGLIVGKVAASRAKREDLITNNTAIRTRMAFGGLTVGVVLNGLVETRVGMSILPLINTPDTVDLVYGAAAATVAGAFIPKVTQSPETEHVRSVEITGLIPDNTE